MAEQRTVKSLRQLPTEVAPPRDLWPGIEARLAAERPQTATAKGRAQFTRMRWWAAAAMVASVAIGVWIGRDLMPLNTGHAPVAAVTEHPVMTEGSAVQAAFQSDPRYVRQRAELMKTLQARLNAMPAPARAKVEASFAALEKAKQDLEDALGKDPTNALLQELLINTYQDEMRVLTDVHQASQPGTGV